MYEFYINDYVVVFGEFEGIVLDIKGDEVTIYCPEFSQDEPYLVTYKSNIELSNCQERPNAMIN